MPHSRDLCSQLRFLVYSQLLFLFEVEYITCASSPPDSHYLASRVDNATSIVWDKNRRKMKINPFKRYPESHNSQFFSEGLASSQVLRMGLFYFLNAFTMERCCARYNLGIKYIQLHTHPTSSLFSREDTNG